MKPIEPGAVCLVLRPSSANGRPVVTVTDLFPLNTALVCKACKGIRYWMYEEDNHRALCECLLRRIDGGDPDAEVSDEKEDVPRETFS